MSPKNTATMYIVQSCIEALLLNSKSAPKRLNETLTSQCAYRRKNSSQIQICHISKYFNSHAKVINHKTAGSFLQLNLSFSKIYNILQFLHAQINSEGVSKAKVPSIPIFMVIIHVSWPKKIASCLITHGHYSKVLLVHQKSWYLIQSLDVSHADV